MSFCAETHSPNIYKVSQSLLHCSTSNFEPLLYLKRGCYFATNSSAQNISSHMGESSLMGIEGE
jgi:hypothetical protein